MKATKKTARGDQGFTLLEIMVVIVVLGILFAYVGVKFGGVPDQARWDQAKIQIKTFETALKMYKLDNGAYPTTEQGLLALVEPPGTGAPAKRWRPGGYLESKKTPLDPWGNDYIYRSPGEHDDYDITSLGMDGQPGGQDYAADVNSWELD